MNQGNLKYLLEELSSIRGGVWYPLCDVINDSGWKYGYCYMNLDCNFSLD